MFAKFKRMVRKFLYKSLWLVLSPFLRLISNPKRVLLTSTRWDGGGAQWHGRFSVMAFADEHKMTYVPSRFTEIVHDNSQEKKELWSNLFTGDFEVPKELPIRVKADSIPLLVRAVTTSFLRRREILIDAGHLHAYTDLFPDAIRRSLQTHRVRYNNPAGIPSSGTDSRGIVMHVRRGFEWEGNFGPNRVTSDDEVLKRLEAVIQATGIGHGVIYSGVPNENLSNRLPEGFVFDHQADEFQVMHHLIKSRVTVMAKSCMSYVSAALAEGTVFYDPFFHPPLPDWRVLDEAQRSN